MTTISRRLVKLFLAAFLLIAGPSPLLATWTPNGAPVGYGTGAQDSQVMVSLLGGAVLAWRDTRNGNDDIYAQILNSDGTTGWTAGGIPLCTDPNSQQYHRLVYEGFGFAKTWYLAAVWQDSRNGNADVYAQCFTNRGTLLYPVDGTPIATGTGDQRFPALTSNGNGTNYVAWENAQGTTSDLYAQAFNHTNSAIWGAGGIPICTASGTQGGAAVAADGTNGGVIVVWNDTRGTSGYDIYAQKVDPAGNVLWTTNGVPVSTAAGSQLSAQVVSDGAGGAVVAWLDTRSPSTEYNIYAQRIDASGNPVWTINGVPVCTAPGSELFVSLIADGSSGAFIVWNDARNPQQPDIYAQHMSGAGLNLWTANGAPVTTAANPQQFPSVASDGMGGIVVTWQDIRTLSQPDVYAQRLDSAGNQVWETDGIPVCDYPYGQFYPRIVYDGRGGSIVAWEDRRSGDADVYAVRIENELGYTGYPQPEITSVLDVPADNGGFVTVEWLPGDGPFDYYDVYRAILPGAAADDGGDGSPQTAKGREFPQRAGCPNGYLWQYMDTTPFTGAPSYSLDVATTADSTASDPAINYYMVIGYTPGVGDPFTSCVAEGYSVDNLAPPAPQLWAQRNGGPVDLTFTRTASDIFVFAIFRSNTPGTPISQGTLITSTPDTTYHDSSAPPGPLYYQVAALDIHANLSEPSNEASVDAPTGIDGMPRMIPFALGGNAPNPFSTGTMLRVASPEARAAVLDVFDAAGRRVRSSRLALQEGWQNISFDGNDDTGRPLASGVYFYRLSSGPEVRTSKMVIYR